MNCIYCGNQLPDKAIFCPKCGKQQEEGVTSRKQEARLKKRRNWGWVVVIFGGLFSLCTIYEIFHISDLLSQIQKVNIEPYGGFNTLYNLNVWSEFFLPGLLIGASIIIIGTRDIIIGSRLGEVSHRSWGLVWVIMGTLYIIEFVFGLTMTLSTAKQYPFLALCFAPFLIIGILGLVYGIRNISRKEIAPQTNIGEFKMPQGDIKV